MSHFTQQTFVYTDFFSHIRVVIREVTHGVSGELGI